MKKNRPTSTYLNALIAGLVASSALASGAAFAQDKAPTATPAANEKDKNACSGPNGCGSKKSTDKKASPQAMDKHACKGQNTCKGKGGCKTDKNACKGHNDCKGAGGCATDGKAHPTPTEKAG